MADYYVRSSTGASTNDGLSWATAKDTVANAIAAPFAAGDTVYVAHDHVESINTRALTFPGNPAQPNRLICVQAGVEPKVLAYTAALNVINASSFQTFTGSVYVSGITSLLGSGTGSSTANFINSVSIDAIQHHQNCDYLMNTTSATASYVIGNNGSSNSARSRLLFNNVRLRLNGASGNIGVYQEWTWRGGKLMGTIGANSPSYLIRNSAQGRGVPIMWEGIDLSEMGATTDICSGPLSAGRIILRNCSLPANWTGQLVQGVQDATLRVEMWNCDSSDTNYRVWIAGYTGSMRSETGVVKNGGANDGVTNFAWKLETNGNAAPDLAAFESAEIIYWNEVVGTPVTIGIDVLNEGLALTNADAWLDVQFLGTSGAPKSTFANQKSSPVAGPTIWGASAASWVTTSLTYPASAIKQRLLATFTAQKVGAVHIRVCLAKAYTTLYVDPEPVVS